MIYPSLIYKRILTVILMSFIAIGVLTPFVVQAIDINKIVEKNNGENLIISNQFSKVYSSEDIQEFFEEQNSVLKDYIYQTPAGFYYTASDLLTMYWFML